MSPAITRHMIEVPQHTAQEDREADDILSSLRLDVDEFDEKIAEVSRLVCVLADLIRVVRRRRLHFYEGSHSYDTFERGVDEVAQIVTQTIAVYKEYVDDLSTVLQSSPDTWTTSPVVDRLEHARIPVWLSLYEAERALSTFITILHFDYLSVT
ncbi:hypothetical protein VNI00_017291 [Paramarasmius palmivorus]|uniref:Uncharacterized protein n=1 Tax=Paramarasmius palmivorus TaxID=297713 RepID=A0AAW0B6P1_9AGAR